jgi:hypothetical protein
MSSKRIDVPDALLRHFSFADGRRCAQPAHPAHDGFCLHHATLRPRPSYSAQLLTHLVPLMRKCVSEIDLYNALSALAREVAARRMGRKRAATLAYLSHALFQSDQMITEKELRTGAGPNGIAFAHSSTTAPSISDPWKQLLTIPLATLTR